MNMIISVVRIINSGGIPTIRNQEMLDLPDGSVLIRVNQLFYQRQPLTRKPTIIAHGDWTARTMSPALCSTVFPKARRMAMIGMMSSDFPSARLTNSTGATRFARTYNRSSATR